MEGGPCKGAAEGQRSVGNPIATPHRPPLSRRAHASQSRPRHGFGASEAAGTALAAALPGAKHAGAAPAAWLPPTSALLTFISAQTTLLTRGAPSSYFLTTDFTHVETMIQGEPSEHNPARPLRPAAKCAGPSNDNRD